MIYTKKETMIIKHSSFRISHSKYSHSYEIVDEIPTECIDNRWSDPSHSKLYNVPYRTHNCKPIEGDITEDGWKSLTYITYYEVLDKIQFIEHTIRSIEHVGGTCPHICRNLNEISHLIDEDYRKIYPEKREKLKSFY